MKKLILTVTAAVIGAAALTSATANAQTAPPADMSRMINDQIQKQKMGDQMARAAAQAYYNYAVRLRAQGYTGEIPFDSVGEAPRPGAPENPVWRQNQLATTGDCGYWYKDGQKYYYCK